MRYLVARIVLIALTTSVIACHKSDINESDATPQITGSSVRFPGESIPPSIKIATASTVQEAQHTIAGRLVWNEERTVRVFSPFAGRVVRIVANYGERVRAGQKLAELDSPDYGSAQADYRKAMAANALAEVNLSRARDLYGHGAIAAKELEKAESDAISAKADAERTARMMRQFNDSGDSINQRLVLRSPIDGVVVERAINPGQEVRTDQSGTALFVVTDPTTLWLALDASEDDVASVKPGDPFKFYAGTNKDQLFTGHIIRVSDYVDPTTRTIKLLGGTSNVDRELKGEMFVTATLVAQSDARPHVPSSAVLLIGDQHYAFVKAGDAFVRHEVKVGAEHNGSIPVLKGLESGDQVVTDGALFLEELLHSQPNS